MTGAPSGGAKAGSPSADVIEQVAGQRTATDAAAIDRAAFAEAMAAFPLVDRRGIAIAVSGGSDSMALLLLLREWCANRHVTLTALTVDHCLRDASGTEAAQVTAWCATLGVTHVVLPWAMGASQRGLSRSPQAAARTARYDLLSGWCRANGYASLCVAHHADDQIETFFLRLARGSGVDGLAAMAPNSRRAGIDILRPLLSFRKDALEATCVAAGQGWVEDPSNGSRKSTRVRFRQDPCGFRGRGFGRCAPPGNDCPLPAGAAGARNDGRCGFGAGLPLGFLGCGPSRFSGVYRGPGGNRPAGAGPDADHGGGRDVWSALRTT